MNCSDCKHWIPVKGKWGKCPLAKTGLFNNRGRKFNHTQARYYTTRACKKRFIERVISNDN